MNNSEQLAQQLLDQLNTTFSQAVQAIRTQAYAEGYRAGSQSSDADCAENSEQSETEPEMLEIDLGLPSGTIWLCQSDLKATMPVQKAMQCGLKLPTQEQIEELLNCRFFGYVFRKPFVLGANGAKYTISETVIPCALISATAVGSDLRMPVRRLCINHEEKSYEWLPDVAFLGDSVRPLFVRSLEA